MKTLFSFTFHCRSSTEYMIYLLVFFEGDQVFKCHSFLHLQIHRFSLRNYYDYYPSKIKKYIDQTQDTSYDITDT
ncbi:hypothetical protein EUGRSUZ_F02261 [Eucalyptus grandis]|uniref:Uncharacterized protein n=2 Tax=Eucalyptus grandis TaxID=71139 RepID=A0ACC3KHG2_EUCGR|nr:hypothetical protein EUGRSUZ_F02261 [Eucalyptus grandis]